MALPELAAELQHLPVGGLLQSSADEGALWLALRERGGVRFALVGSPEAGAVELTHALRSDLHFLGAVVQPMESGLSVEGPPPSKPASARLDEAKAAVGQLPKAAADVRTRMPALDEQHFRKAPGIRASS